MSISVRAQTARSKRRLPELTTWISDAAWPDSIRQHSIHPRVPGSATGHSGTLSRNVAPQQHSPVRRRRARRCGGSPHRVYENVSLHSVQESHQLVRGLARSTTSPCSRTNGAQSRRKPILPSLVSISVFCLPAKHFQRGRPGISVRWPDASAGYTP
jgi:hypothetical protein